MSGQRFRAIRVGASNTWGVYDGYERRWIQIYTGPRAQELAGRRQSERTGPQFRARPERRRKTPARERAAR